MHSTAGRHCSNLSPQEMLSCFTPRELARLPPFPFPKELFPPGAMLPVNSTRITTRHPKSRLVLHNRTASPGAAGRGLRHHDLVHGRLVSRHSMCGMHQHNAPALRPLPGTFPPGMRFSSKGLKGMPPQVGSRGHGALVGAPLLYNVSHPPTGLLLSSKPTCILYSR